MRCVLVAALGATLTWAPLARADGVKIQSHVTLTQLVQSSSAIFTATIRKVKQTWATREAYGKKRRYVSSFELQVEVGTWLKGERPSWLKKTVWLTLDGDPPPGKWVLVHESYDDSAFSKHAAAARQKVIVFVQQLDETRMVLEKGREGIAPRALDSAERLEAVMTALAASGQRPDAAAPPSPP